MSTRKKLKLKKPFVKILKIIGIILVFIIGILVFYLYQIKKITDLGYSRIAAKNILLLGKREYVKSVEDNKTLNAAFESRDYVEANLDSYSKIKYQNQKHLIKNINALIKKGYSNNNISIILSHGNDDDVSEFAKRDKIKYLE